MHCGGGPESHSWRRLCCLPARGMATVMVMAVVAVVMGIVNGQKYTRERPRADWRCGPFFGNAGCAPPARCSQFGHCGVGEVFYHWQGPYLAEAASTCMTDGECMLAARRSGSAGSCCWDVLHYWYVTGGCPMNSAPVQLFLPVLGAMPAACGGQRRITIRIARPTYRLRRNRGTSFRQGRPVSLPVTVQSPRY